MQRIKSNAILRRPKSANGGPVRALDRKVSINSGAFAGTALAHDVKPVTRLPMSASAGGKP